MNIDILSHSNTLCNKILKSLNLNCLCKYDSFGKAYLFEHSNAPVNCSYILIFLKTLACYTITPDTHQWYRINTNEILDRHNVAICNEATVNMVLLSPVEPYKTNAIETFARLAPPNSQTDIDCITDGQFIANNHNTNKCNASSNSIIPPDYQSTIILQQFSIMIEELKKISPNKCPVI